MLHCRRFQKRGEATLENEATVRVEVELGGEEKGILPPSEYLKLLKLPLKTVGICIPGVESFGNKV